MLLARSYISCVKRARRSRVVTSQRRSHRLPSTRDAGKDMPHGKLPVDERNPVIIYNDSSLDNWMGEYAFLLANSGGPPVAGIISSSSGYWRDATANASGWSDLLSAARSSGLKN